MDDILKTNGEIGKMGEKLTDLWINFQFSC